MPVRCTTSKHCCVWAEQHFSTSHFSSSHSLLYQRETCWAFSITEQNNSVHCWYNTWVPNGKMSSYSQTQSYCGLKMDNNSPVTGTLKVCHLVPQVIDQAADNLFACKLHKDYPMLLDNNGVSSSSLESYIFIGALHVGTVSPTNSSKGIEFYISVEVLWKILT